MQAVQDGGGDVASALQCTYWLYLFVCYIACCVCGNARLLLISKLPLLRWLCENAAKTTTVTLYKFGANALTDQPNAYGMYICMYICKVTTFHKTYIFFKLT